MKAERLPDPASAVSRECDCKNNAAAPAEEEHRDGRETGGDKLDAEDLSVAREDHWADWDDWASQWDDDPNPYHGTYSEE